MLTVRALANEAVAATQDDPEGSALTVNEILRLLDVTGTRNPHLENPLNHPRHGYVRARRAPLRGDELVDGEFLSLTYCAHDPFVRLTDHDDLESLARSLASNSGVVNWFDKYLQNTTGPQAAERVDKRWVIWDEGAR